MVDLNRSHDLGNGPFPETPEEIFAEIGCRLVLLQDLEMYLAFVAKVIFESDSEKAREAILKADNKTMGQLLNALRSKVEISHDFDAALKRTLEARNTFVHEFSHIFNLKSESGIRKAVNFLIKSMDDLEEVSNTLRAAIVIFGREKGVFDDELESNWRKYGDLTQLENLHIPKFHQKFKQRKN